MAVTIAYITITKNMVNAGTASMGTNHDTNDEAAEIQQHSIMKFRKNVRLLLKPNAILFDNGNTV